MSKSKLTPAQEILLTRKVSPSTTKKRVATPVKNPFIFDPKTDKVEFRMPTPIAEVERRAKLYLGDDPAKFLHSNRTHRTASEAFRDADYATAIWKCKTDWDRFKEYLGWGVMWAGFLFLMYQSMVGFEKWIGS
jgi:hypothetical protein